MELSRRVALQYGSAFAATGGAASPAAAFAQSVTGLAGRQKLSSSAEHQHFLSLAIPGDGAQRQPVYVAFAIRSANSIWSSFGHMEPAAYRKARDQYALRGYRLRYLKAHETAKGTRYAAIWQYASGPMQQVSEDMPLAQLAEKSARLAQRGYRIAHLDVRGTTAEPRYMAIWEYGGAPQKVSAGLTSSEYQEQSAALTSQGYRVRQISGYGLEGQSRFAAVFDRSDAGKWEAQHQMSAAAFGEKSRALGAQGYLLTNISGHMAGEHPVFSGLWEKA
jgi:hypothetical protein